MEKDFLQDKVKELKGQNVYLQDQVEELGIKNTETLLAIYSARANRKLIVALALSWDFILHLCSSCIEEVM
ncbi:Cyclic AMP-responsive element-binding protein 3-like protein 4 [Bienertia sinuspersici]